MNAGSCINSFATDTFDYLLYIDLARYTLTAFMYKEDRSCLTQFRMGQMFIKGNNPRDYELAAHWYLGSAKQGYREAQRRIGALYALGYGVPKNYIKAYAWFKVAAAQGSPKAPNNLKKVQTRMSAKQIFYARKLANQYYQAFVVPFSD